jgi:RNA polymerase sigma-70 factor (ECF subfamily)
MSRRNPYQSGEREDPQGQPDQRLRSDEPNDPELDIEKKWLQLTRVDARQFRFFYDKYHDAIFRFIYWKTGNYELSGDLTGDVFLEALDRLDRFSWQRYSFSTWLFQIARKVVKRHWRSRRTTIEAEFERVRSEDNAPATPAEEAGRRQDREIIRHCLARLGSDRHDVFVFHYWMGFTVRETALAMKMGESNVKQHLSRGRRQMLTMIRDMGLEQEFSAAGRQVVKELEIEETGIRIVTDRKDEE